ncbi:MAG: serine/threonine protein kinase [Deltaproteobacteria bacterium]|nr:serine/threonine protein kinase [Deltaproteobacteria bacterium]
MSDVASAASGPRVLECRHPHREATVAASSGSGSLPTDVMDAGNRRLVIAALVYAGAWIVAMLGAALLTTAILPAVGAPDTGPPGGLAYQYGLSAVVITGSLAFAWLLRARRAKGHACGNLAIGFELFGALGILMSELWHGVPLEAAGHNAGGISWVCGWMIFFPIVVPSTKRRAVVATMLTAATGPAMLLIVWLRDVPLPGPATIFFWVLSFPMSAGMALVGARVVHGLGREVAKARELGSYRLVERLGRGGMGEVWRAEHRLLARPAAVKLIRPETLSRAGGADAAVKRFEREALITAGLRSPHTIALYDFGQAPDGSLYYAMELLEGMDLETMVQRFGPIPAPRTIYLLQQVCRSLAEAHASGLVHRDVKPANVFVCRLGLSYDFVKVLDFGLVKPSQAQTDVKLTAEGVASGTPAYMAPEVATGEAEVDARADLYALGCVAYWMLTGQLVFEGGSAVRVIADHVRTPPVPPSQRTEVEIPDALEALVLEMLEKAPADRPADALEVLRRLSAIELDDPWTEHDGDAWWQTHQPQARPAGVRPSTSSSARERAA